MLLRPFKGRTLAFWTICLEHANVAHQDICRGINYCEDLLMHCNYPIPILHVKVADHWVICKNFWSVKHHPIIWPITSLVPSYHVRWVSYIHLLRRQSSEEAHQKFAEWKTVIYLTSKGRQFLTWLSRVHRFYPLFLLYDLFSICVRAFLPLIWAILPYVYELS